MDIAARRLPISRGNFRLSTCLSTLLILAWPGAALAQVKSYAFVPGHLDNIVTVIDTGGHSVLGSAVPTGSSPFSATASPDGRLVYVANTLGNNITVIDVATRAVIGSPIPVENGPWGVTFTKDGRTAYVSNQTGNSQRHRRGDQHRVRSSDRASDQFLPQEDRPHAGRSDGVCHVERRRVPIDLTT